MTFYFQLKDGQVTLAHEGDLESLKAELIKDRKEAEEVLTKGINECVDGILKVEKEVKESKEEITPAKNMELAQLKIRKEANEVELKRIKEMKTDDFKFFTMSEVKLD